ncbi:MAG TPA: alpha/beta hydrolase [Pararhizobium sp.]|uniref:alpha/beta hydrolase n=1 Tax=Pararhizobium sp. TaxID=1977563 RepID=UPI002CFA6F84|nr:alpha/beta hydrolase [Pararhizobium sp.]HTO32102.1 alpha/beta hydrolase [Pararhizobium sp.]
MVEMDPFRTRSHVADFDEIVAEIVSESARTRDELPMVADIPYGTGDGETLDIFLPACAREKLPVHIFIHGGYWRMFSKKDYSSVATTITRAGAIAVIVDYAKMPAVRMNAIIDQIQRAKRWVTDNISSYGGDVEQLTVSGHSAGAHLATFLLRQDSADPKVRAAFLLGGIYDLAPLQGSFLAPEIGITDEEVAEFSPMLHAYHAGCSVSIAVGENETAPFHRQAKAFATCLEKQGLVVSNRIISGGNHMSSVRDLGRSDAATASILAELIVANSTESR